MQPRDLHREPSKVVQVELRKLTKGQVQQIDEALVSIGDYGEVRLIVQHGELRYINRVESLRAWDGRNDKKPGPEK